MLFGHRLLFTHAGEFPLPKATQHTPFWQSDVPPQGGVLLELLVVELLVELVLLLVVLVVLEPVELLPLLVALEPAVVPEPPQHPKTFAPLTTMKQAVCMPVQLVALPTETVLVPVSDDETALPELLVDDPP